VIGLRLHRVLLARSSLLALWKRRLRATLSRVIPVVGRDRHGVHLVSRSESKSLASRITQQDPQCSARAERFTQWLVSARELALSVQY
jgi:hypothetical protein